MGEEEGIRGINGWNKIKFKKKLFSGKCMTEMSSNHSKSGVTPEDLSAGHITAHASLFCLLSFLGVNMSIDTLILAVESEDAMPHLSYFLIWLPL